MRMDKEIKKNIWEELKILQTIVNKFDDFSFRIKQWLFTFFIAIAGFSISEESLSLLCLNFILVPMFYLFEISYRVSHRSFLERLDELQNALKDEKFKQNTYEGPYLDKYFSSKEKDGGLESADPIHFKKLF